MLNSAKGLEFLLVNLVLHRNVMRDHVHVFNLGLGPSVNGKLMDFGRAQLLQPLPRGEGACSRHLESGQDGVRDTEQGEVQEACGHHLVWRHDEEYFAWGEAYPKSVLSSRGRSCRLS